MGTWAINRPRLSLSLWAVVTGLLIWQAFSFEERLAPSTLDVPGTASARAEAVSKRYFGGQSMLPVLLEGPQDALRRQGHRLVEDLRTREDLRVVSPWDEGQAIPELRPRPGVAMILVVASTGGSYISGVGQEVRRTADEGVSPPVRVSLAGFSLVSADLKDESLAAVHAAEVIAVPILLLVLLLVFRSPVAALIPPVFGAAAVASGYGAVGLLGLVQPISDVALALTSMMGLALGVDYSLLLVSRFREELAHGAKPHDAAVASVGSAGRTVIFAGATLAVAMVGAIALSPGDYLLSAAASVLVVAVLGVFGSLVAVPPMLALLGTRVNLWRIGAEPRDGGGWARMARAVQRRPARWGLVALLPLAALTVPALGLETGPPDVQTMPEDSRTRQDAARSAEILGPGWAVPFDVIVSDPAGPVTTPDRLRELRDWQRQVARWEGVDTVIGPGQIASSEPRLLTADRTLARTERSLRGSRRGAERLNDGLGRATDGVGRLRSGLVEAATASQRLRDGADEGSAASAQLAGALEQARDGADRLQVGIARARDGAGRLSSGAGGAHAGASRLAAGNAATETGARKLAVGGGRLAQGLRDGQRQLQQLRAPAAQATADADALLRALGGMSLGRADPRYRAALEAAGKLSAFTTGRDPRTGQLIDPAYTGLSAALAQGGDQLGTAAAAAAQLQRGADRLASGLGRLRDGGRRLATGLDRLQRGADRLQRGLQQITARTGELPVGLGRLRDGAQQLSGGLQRLEDGNRRLAGGLDDGAARTRDLQGGLARARDRTADAGDQAARTQRLARLRDRSPRLLDSGYFVLAALDGSKPGARTQAGLGVNLEGGGQAARITVIPTTGVSEAATVRLRDRLQAAMPALARDTGADAQLGGVGAQIVDYERELGGRLPILAIVLSIISAIVLVVVLRTIVLALISIALNLITVGAAFGIVALLFTGTDPLLGGPGWGDILSLLAMFTIMFALSLDYQVFIVTRMYEAWKDQADLEHAITYAIDRTGRVVTGAAGIMGAVFIAFTTADLTIIKQTGVGLAAAVIIDATLVRMVLLPAAMTLAGRWTFWLPAWLDRRLPNLNLEGDVGRPDGTAPAPA